MTVDARHEALVQPDPAESDRMQKLLDHLDRICSQAEPRAQLLGPGEERVEVSVSALKALRLVAEGMARGKPMLLAPRERELTTQEAADLLHVSRPHLVKLLEQGEMPFHYVGKPHRRIKLEDVLAYRERRDDQRRRALDRLTELSEGVPGGYE